MKMLNDNVLVALMEDEKEERTTAGGIILTGAVETGLQSKPATVLAIGPDVQGVQVSDTVYLDWLDAINITVKGNQGHIIKADKIKAVL
jgi:co-chaperonin GroES (HSP10)|tara:strand:- start:5073 stop:5339 length:267 start_codon:yes stop_codon:yes gene_type:complete